MPPALLLPAPTPAHHTCPPAPAPAPMPPLSHASALSVRASFPHLLYPAPPLPPLLQACEGVLAPEGWAAMEDPLDQASGAPHIPCSQSQFGQASDPGRVAVRSGPIGHGITHVHCIVPTS